MFKMGDNVQVKYKLDCTGFKIVPDGTKGEVVGIHAIKGKEYEYHIKYQRGEADYVIDWVRETNLVKV